MTKIEIMKEKNNLVNIHNDLVFSQHSLSEQAMKIMKNLICMIHKDDKDFNEYYFDGKSFKDLINSKSKNIISDMKKNARELKSKSVIIKKEKSILETNMIISFEYEKQGGYIKFMIHPDLKPYLLNLKNNYLSYGIKNILSLKGNYTIRLYEILKHKFNQSAKHTKNPFISFSMDLQDLKDEFQIPKSYNLHKIKTHILEKSKKEFSDKTDIFFKYELSKKFGRSFDTITFSIGKNKIKN